MAFDESMHPRVPAGQTGGGQFTLSLNSVSQDSSGKAFPVGSRQDMQKMADAWNAQTKAMGYSLNHLNEYSVVPASNAANSRPSRGERAREKSRARTDAMLQRATDIQIKHARETGNALNRSAAIDRAMNPPASRSVPLRYRAGKK